MIQMRQVDKEEFEILTRFHPGEIRYYVDISKSVTRNRGAKINVKRQPAGTNGAAAPKKTSKQTKPRVPGGGRGTNMPIRLTTTDHEFRDGTKYRVMHNCLKRTLENDPTKVMGRTEVVKSIMSDLPNYRPNQVNPFVTDCLKLGIIRYVGQ
jgi:hypothetical protein